MYRILALAFVLLVSSKVSSQDIPIQPGDLLRISVYDNPDLTTEAEVSNNGYINMPLVGEVQIAQLGSNEAAAKIEGMLVSKKVLKNPQIIIVILDSKSSTVSILGNVYTPGKYKISAGARTIVDFISLAGGLTPNASTDLIIIKPNSEQANSKIIMNLYEIFQSGDVSILNSEDFLLKSGDIVFVPEAPIFYIYGQVNRPGSYTLKKDMTVAQALALGGGISNQGTIRGLTIKRKTLNGGFEDIKADETSVIQANDTLYINESIF